MHSLFYSEFCIESDLVLPPSVSNILAFIYGHLVYAYVFFSIFPSHIFKTIFPSITCFRRQFLCKMWPVHLAFLLCTVLWMFLSSMTLCNTSSLPTLSANWSSQSISNNTFKNFPGISDLLFGVQVKAPYKALFEFEHLLVASLNLQFDAEKSFLFFEYRFCHGNPGFIFICSYLPHSLWCCPNSRRIPYSVAVLIHNYLYSGWLR